MISSRALYRSFGVILALLAFLVGLSIYNFRELQQASDWRVHTYQTLLATERILQSITITESGARGFFLSGNEEFLAPYNDGVKSFPGAMQEALDLMKDRPEEMARLQKIQTLQEDWVTNYLTPALEVRRTTPDTDTALALVRAGSQERKQLTTQMRTLLAQVETTERALLIERTAKTQQHLAVTKVVLSVGGIFSLLVAVTLAALALSAFKRLDASNARLIHSNSQLEDLNARLAGTNNDLLLEVNKRRAAEDRLHEVLDDLKRSNSDLEQFAYVASHDLQEPLRAVAGCVQVLKKRYGGQLDARADQFIEHAVDGAHRMQNLIHDLLAYSRVGTQGKEFANVRMNDVLKSVMRSLSVAIAESKAEITHDSLPEIQADGGQVELVVQNLVSNALKFRGGKPPVIHIGYAIGSNNGHDEHIFTIRDNGPGIEPQYFERIFVMFQRLHTRTEYSGTGIGLAICKKVIERHGGRIWVESKPGEGSTFAFAIPVNIEAVEMHNATKPNVEETLILN